MRLLLIALLALPCAATAQPTDADVMAPVHQLFGAMRAADSSAARAAFHPTATLYSVGAGHDGEVAVRTTPVERFIEAIGAPREAVWDERLGDAEVRTDGDLATVWVPYAFYLGEAFSHCGTNAFHLARTDGAWRILHVTDTRRRDGCDPSVR